MAAGGVERADRLGGLRPIPVARPNLSDAAPRFDPPPNHDELVGNLKLLREKGWHDVRVPAIATAALQAGEAADEDQASQPPAQQELLRRAVAGLGDGRLGNAAAASFGFTRELRDAKPGERRLVAAQYYVQDPESFRKTNELVVLGEIADEILRLIHVRRMRQTHVLMEKRHPADSHLAVQWVERFEAYYALYTPISALAGDLRAAVDTRLYQREEPVWWAERGEGEAWDPEFQAEGYVRFALYHYTHFLLLLRRFEVRHGGMWLLGNQEREYAVANTVYAIQWNNDLNERDDSWLRSTLGDIPGEELHPFLALLASDTIGRATHDEYQDWVRTCDCVGKPTVEAWALPGEPERFYTAGEIAAIQQMLDSGTTAVAGDCQVHATIRACEDYALMTDLDWEAIVDWWRK